MTLDEARALVGQKVIYRPPHVRADEPGEEGVRVGRWREGNASRPPDFPRRRQVIASQLLDGLDAVELGPRRTVKIKHPPTLEWVTHGCVECGTRNSFAWYSIPYRDTEAPVCGDCYGVEYHEVHPTTAITCSACGVLLRRIPESYQVHVPSLTEYHRAHLDACGGHLEVGGVV